MAYTPPTCGSSEFTLDKVRSTACGNIEMYLGDPISGIVNKAIISSFVEYGLLHESGSMSLTPSELLYSCDIEASIDQGPYQKARFGVGGECDIELRTDGIVKKRQNALPTGTDNFAGVRWGDGVKVDVRKSARWEESENRDVPVHTGWGNKSNVDVQVNDNMPLSQTPTDIQSYVNWQDFVNNIDSVINLNVRNKLTYTDTRTSIRWGTFSNTDARYTVSWLHPPKKDGTHNVKWRGFFDHSTDYHLSSRYANISNPKDFMHSTIWGPKWYAEMFDPCRKFRPTNMFYLEEPMTTAGVCRDVEHFLFCDPRRSGKNPHDYFHSGNRDLIYVGPGSPVIPDIIIGRSVYTVHNTILVTRIVDSLPIDVLSVTARLDKGSWLWDFSMTVADRATLNQLIPYKNGNDTEFHDVEININGNIWTCRVENWSENRAFGSDTWTLTGRSPSSLLTSPFQTPESYISPASATQGGAIVQDILSGTTWSEQWGYDGLSTSFSEYMNPFTDWLVPSEGYSYTDKTKIQAMQDVLSAIGANIVTNPNCDETGDGSKTLIIVPEYPIRPWMWSTADPDILLPEELCRTIGRTFTDYTRVNEIITSGINHGVITQCIINGSGGGVHAPMFSHQLITSDEVSAEKAKNTLAKSGMWSNHTLTLLSLQRVGSSTDPTARLILPGELVSVTENGSSWRGQSTGTTITGLEVKQARAVSQTITVEEYLG